MNYLYQQVDEAADQLLRDRILERRLFAGLLKKVAKALHDIEWVDSCDYSTNDELDAIKACLNFTVDDTLKAILLDLRGQLDAIESKIRGE